MSETAPRTRCLPEATALFAAAFMGTASAGPAFEVCVDYHCDERAAVVLPDDDWSRIAALLSGRDDSASERAGIRDAVALLERLVGAQTGTWQDRDRNNADHGGRGQLDCIAESTNTSTYLRLFGEAGLLRWHAVEARVKRQRWLFAVHWTAVIRDEASGERFAVDSWYGDNGTPPQVLPLAVWRDGGRETRPPVVSGY